MRPGYGKAGERARQGLELPGSLGLWRHRAALTGGAVLAGLLIGPVTAYTCSSSLL
jgi:hypothetical protein